MSAGDGLIWTVMFPEEQGPIDSFWHFQAYRGNKHTADTQRYCELSFSKEHDHHPARAPIDAAATTRIRFITSRFEAGHVLVLRAYIT